MSTCSITRLAAAFIDTLSTSLPVTYRMNALVCRWPAPKQQAKLQRGWPKSISAVALRISCTSSNLGTSKAISLRDRHWDYSDHGISRGLSLHFFALELSTRTCICKMMFVQVARGERDKPGSEHREREKGAGPTLPHLLGAAAK